MIKIVFIIKQLIIIYYINLIKIYCSIKKKYNILINLTIFKFSILQFH